jgi:hypothetical protein
MRREMLLTICSVALMTSLTRSQDRGLGIGVIVGDPTGISTKIWTTSTNALQFALAWQARDPFLGTRVSFSGDYLWHSFDAIHSTQRFPVFYGVGGVLASGGGADPALGVRGVVGIDWLSRQSPIDVFVQVVPILVLAPSTDLELGAGVGIRYFFD